MAHVAEFKKRIVKELVKLMQDYPIIGSVNMENLPAAQLQKMREQLRNTVVIRMTKRRLMRIAIDKVKEKKPGIEKLNDSLLGMPALLFTRENPFKLCKTLQKNKSPAPAKAGQKAPKDIMVNAGPTPFNPGPVIGELGSIGVKVAIEGGKVSIKDDTVVAREGEVIKPKVAEMLGRLGINPMEIGLDLVAVYEDGSIYKKDILAVDEAQYIDMISNAANDCMSLSMEIGYACRDTAELLITKAYLDAKALAREQSILADEMVEEMIAKADNQMKSLASEAKLEVAEKKVEKKEEAPKEEKKPEIKEEKPEVKKEPKPEEKPEEKEEKPEQKEAPKEQAKPEPEKKEAPKEEVKEDIKKEVKEEPKEVPKEEPAPKEEPKKEKPEPKEQPKQAQKEEPKPEPEKKEVPEEKPEEKKEPVEEDIDKKIDDNVTRIVEAAKKHAKGEPLEDKGPSAEELVDEAQKEEKKEAEKIPTAEELVKKKEKKEAEKIPTAEELAKRKKKTDN